MDLICHPNAQMNAPAPYLQRNDVFYFFTPEISSRGTGREGNKQRRRRIRAGDGMVMRPDAGMNWVQEQRAVLN